MMDRPCFSIALVLAFHLFFASAAAASPVVEGARPTLRARTLDGGGVDLAALRGSVVLVDFWATWCRPCLRSLPFYGELYERYQKEGLVVLAISVDEHRREVEGFVRQHPLPFPVLHDTDHRLARAFGPPTMPTFYLIDRNGVVAFRHVGFHPRDRQEIEARVKNLLESKGSRDSDEGSR